MRFCLRQGVDIAATSSVLYALSDLAMVRSVLRAMNAADRMGARCERLHSHPAAGIEPRQRISPAPTIRPRFVVQPSPRIEPRPVAHVASTSTAATEPAAPQRPHADKNAIQPPWALLPWEQKPRLEIHPPIKVVHRSPDVFVKGRLIDLLG
jgi:hypothetical protein